MIVLMVTARNAPTTAASRIGTTNQTMVVHHAVETTTSSRTVIRQPWLREQPAPQLSTPIGTTMAATRAIRVSGCRP
jgi:hypothetical protein